MKKILSLILVVVLLISLILTLCFNTAALNAISEPLGLYCSTNPDGKCGVKKTISIDGNISDWDNSMLITQGLCNDDPRVYMDSSMHENPIDSYALYAAWDDTNLYLMWEMKNMQDIVAPSDDYPLSQGLLYQTTNLPIFIAFKTGKSTIGDGTVTDGSTIWGSGITYEAGIDTMLACSTNGSNGPYVYTTNSSGKFVYNDTRQSTIKMGWGNNQSVSTTCMGIEGGYGKSHNRTPGDIINKDANWMDYYQTKHDKKLDFFYEMSIPFSVLNIDKSYLENTGISVMHVMTFGISGMNCLPVDLSMTDNANKPYSKDASSTQEKEDEDNITVPLAQIGKCTSPGPKPTQPGPSEKYLYGDVDLNNNVEVKDATMIQQSLSRIISFTPLQEKIAKVDATDTVSIKDATLIQQKLARVIDTFPSGEYLIID